MDKKTLLLLLSTYNFIKYTGQGNNGSPSTWSVYFGGYNYDTAESALMIWGDYSRSQFMEDRNKYGW